MSGEGHGSIKIYVLHLRSPYARQNKTNEIITNIKQEIIR